MTTVTEKVKLLYFADPRGGGLFSGSWFAAGHRPAAPQILPNNLQVQGRGSPTTCSPQVATGFFYI